MALKNELRLNNLINCIYHDDDDNETSCIGRVMCIDDTGLGEWVIWVDSEAKVEEYDSFEPINLTEEWLIKFGFELNVDGYWIDRNNIVFDMGCLCIGNYFESEKDHYQLVGAEITHVHSFQNGYMFLTGEELKTTK